MRPSSLLVCLAVALGLAVPAATARTTAAAHDGVQLVGHRFGGARAGSKPAVVLAHMSNGSLCEWLPEARRLAARGIWVFAFDFRGHGFSQGTQRYGRLGLDVAAAVKAARGLGARKVVIAGASLGGIAVVVAGATITPAVSGV